MALNPIQQPHASKVQLADRYQKASSPAPAPGQASSKDLSNHQPLPSLSDQAEISSQAHKFVDLRQALDAGQQEIERTPDLRANKVARAKERLSSGFYHSAEVRDKVAGRLSQLFLEPDLF